MRPTIAPEDVRGSLMGGKVMPEHMNESAFALNTALNSLCQQIAYCCNDGDEWQRYRRELEKIARKRGAE